MKNVPKTTKKQEFIASLQPIKDKGPEMPMAEIRQFLDRQANETKFLWEAVKKDPDIFIKEFDLGKDDREKSKTEYNTFEGKLKKLKEAIDKKLKAKEGGIEKNSITKYAISYTVNQLLIDFAREYIKNSHNREDLDSMRKKRNKYINTNMGLSNDLHKCLYNMVANHNKVFKKVVMEMFLEPIRENINETTKFISEGEKRTNSYKGDSEKKNASIYRAIESELVSVSYVVDKMIDAGYDANYSSVMDDIDHKVDLVFTKNKTNSNDLSEIVLVQVKGMIAEETGVDSRGVGQYAVKSKDVSSDVYDSKIKKDMEEDWAKIYNRKEKLNKELNDDKGFTEDVITVRAEWYNVGAKALNEY